MAQPNNKPIPDPKEKEQPKGQFDAPEVIDRYWQKFFKANGYEAERHGEQALEWFRMRISKDLKVHAKQIITAPSGYNKFSKEHRTMLGKLYLFEYKAEQAGDEESGTYDRYPMVFFFNMVKNKEGKTLLYGLNMHYLLPKQRAVLYHGLMKLKVSKKWTPNVKLRMQWDMIKKVANHKLMEKAVHAYRVDRLQSRFVEIQPNDWIIAAFLRLERWVQVQDHKHAVQSDANKIVKNKNLLKTANVAKKAKK